MSENINYTYESKPIDTAILSVLDVTSDGKVVSAADWTALWNAVLVRINHIDTYCASINVLVTDWQESIAAFEKAVTDIDAMYNTLSNSFIHYGEEAPTDNNIRLWVQPSSEVDDKSLVNKAELVAAITNSEAKANKLERIKKLTIAPELPKGVTQFIADSNINEIKYPTTHTSIDGVNKPSWLSLMGPTIPKDSVITVYHRIDPGPPSVGVSHTFYLKTNTHWSNALDGSIEYGYYIFNIRIKDSVVLKGTHQFIEGNTEFPNIPKVSQSFNPNSEDAQSGIAIDKYVTANFSDIIVETSHSVNSPAEVDCCLKGQNIVGGNILGAEPRVILSKNLCPTPEVNFEGDTSQMICIPNEDGTFNYTGYQNNIVTIDNVVLEAGTYTFSCQGLDLILYVPEIYNDKSFIYPGSFTITYSQTIEIIIFDQSETSHIVENCWVQIEKGTSATAFSPYFSGERLNLPKNPVMHFAPTNPIKNRTFIGNDIKFEEGSIYHYTFPRAWIDGFNENAMKLEIGQEYIMKFDVTCTDINNPSKWSFGVFSSKKYSSAYNVSSKTLITVKEIGTDSIVYQNNIQSISYVDFGSISPAIMKYEKRYIIELIFTSSYSGEVYFGMRSEGALSVDLWSSLFCKTESLPMLVDKKINTNLMGIGNISDSIDLVSKQKTQKIIIDALSFEEEQHRVDNYNKALPSVPAYFISGTLENPDWIERVTPASGTNDYTLSQPILDGYIVYATRTPVTEQIDIDIPVVCTDEFEVYTSSDDDMVPYFQTSVDTKKSANKYLKKISNTIISMGGNI